MCQISLVCCDQMLKVSYAVNGKRKQILFHAAETVRGEFELIWQAHAPVTMAPWPLHVHIHADHLSM